MDLIVNEETHSEPCFARKPQDIFIFQLQKITTFCKDVFFYFFY